MASIGLRNRKKNQVKRMLYQAALDLFREQGYLNTTIEMIAAQANQSRSTFFNYFSLKEEILFKINENALKFTNNQLKIIEAASNTQTGVLMGLLDDIGTELKRDKRLYAGIFRDLMLLEVSPEPEKRKRGISQICIPLARIFKEGQKNEEFLFEETPLEIAQAFFGMLFTASLNYVYSSRINIHKRLETIGKLFLQGIKVK